MTNRKHAAWSRTLLFLLATLLLATSYAHAIGVGCNVCKEGEPVDQGPTSTWE